MNDIWFADEVLTDCSGSPRLLPPLPVTFAEMLHDSYIRTDTRIKQTGTVWPDTIYFSAVWRVSGRIQVSQAFVSRARGNVKARGPATGPVFILWGASDDKQQREALGSEMNPNSLAQKYGRRSFSLSRNCFFSLRQFFCSWTYRLNNNHHIDHVLVRWFNERQIYINHLQKTRRSSCVDLIWLLLWSKTPLALYPKITNYLSCVAKNAVFLLSH